MADEMKPTTVTTSDRCPECGAPAITPRDDLPPDGTAQVWTCSPCGFVFYRYRPADEAAVGEGRRRLPPPIDGGAAAHRLAG